MEIIGSGCFVFIPFGFFHHIRVLARENRLLQCTSSAGSCGVSENYTGIANLNAMVLWLDEAAAAV